MTDSRLTIVDLTPEQTLRAQNLAHSNGLRLPSIRAAREIIYRRDQLEELATTAQFVLDQIADPANAEHTLGAYKLGIGYHRLRQLLSTRTKS